MTRSIWLTSMILIVIALCMALIPNRVCRALANAALILGGVGTIILLIFMYGGPIEL